MSNDKTYHEMLRDEMDRMVDELADLNDEEVLEAELHRNSAYSLASVLLQFARTESPLETSADREHRGEVVTNALAILDGHILLTGMKAGEHPPDREEEAATMNVTLRYPHSLAVTAFISAAQAFFSAPEGSGAEQTYNQLLVDLAEEWPTINEDIQSQLAEKLNQVFDLDSEDDDFTDIDITDIGDSDE